jgi:protein involved in polysaccharide export with SLBB domain
VSGDELIVPKYNAQVRISGSVLFPTQIPYNEKYSLNDYISSAGGVAENGKRGKTYVVYANGKAAAKRGFLFFKSSPEVRPGAEVIVPSKEEEKKDDNGRIYWHCQCHCFTRRGGDSDIALLICLIETMLFR